MIRALTLAVFFLCAIPVTAQDKPFVLKWHGQSFFQLETPSGKKIVFDPHAIAAFGRVSAKADILLLSHLHNDHNTVEVVENHMAARTFNGLKVAKGRPADWNKIDEKVGGIRIRTVGCYHDNDNGMRSGKNGIFIVEADGVTFCHLGDIGHEVDAPLAKLIGEVDVLMVPVGGVYTVNGAQAKKIVEAIKPKRFVIPMHYGMVGYDDLLPPDEFLEGQKNVKKMTDTNELEIKKDDKPEAPTVVLLGYEKKAK